MWWRNSQRLVVVLLLAVSGCGFHPLYGNKTSAIDPSLHDNFARVHISPIDNRNGLVMYNALELRMQNGASTLEPLYRLQITLQQNMAGINYQKNATASGGETTMAANWQLLDYHTGQRLAYGVFSSVDSVNYLGPRYASVAAEQDAWERSANDIADMITDRVAVYLSKHPQ